MIWLITVNKPGIIFRLGKCKKGVGNRGGLPRINKRTHTATLEGTGRPERRATGRHAQISLVKFQERCWIEYISKALVYLVEKRL